MSDVIEPGGVETLVRNGGRLCLDFVNTVEPRRGPVSRDWLTGYADLVTWARHGGLLDDAGAAALRAAADARPADAGAAFRDAVELRESLYRVFAAIADGTEPAEADLDALRVAFTAATGYGRLVPRAGGFEWSWDGREPAGRLDRPLWPVVASAMDLLTRGPLDRIKQCPEDGGCSWLFVDATKNRSRRWCSMDDCGSNAKARRQTDKRRAARRATGPA